jgi:DNA-directed RNA polymerase subunit RPC12/RpoP
MHHLQCQNCSATVVVEPGLRTAACPYCASPQVVERPPTRDMPNPELVMGFALSREPATELARRWLRQRSIFAVSGVRHAAIDAIRGVYLPVYLYGATAHTRFAAEVGERYTVQHKDKSERRTEWRPLEGVRSEYVSDVLVTASRGVPNAELEGIEPFDLRAIHRYSPAMIAGWIAEEPSLDFEHCLDLSRREAHAAAGRKLPAFLPGDTHRGLRHETRFTEESLALVLVPVWVLAVRYDPRRPPFRLLVNGQTGKAWGQAPLSWAKIVLAVLGVVLAGLFVAAGAALALGAADGGGF